MMGSNAEYAMSTLSRKVAQQDARIAELTAEVARLVESHTYIAKTWPDSSAARHSRSTVARNALKDGV
jgi:uncharacterized small protein (DUF1192 family)